MDVKFDKQYTVSSSGRGFTRFVTDDGHRAEIMTRTGRYEDSMPIWTRAEAKAFATVHFLRKCAGPGVCPVTVHS